MPIPNATTPEASRVQRQLLRQAGISGRFKKMASLSHSVIMMSKRAIARKNPGLSAFEQAMLFVSLHYGAELEREVREFLSERGRSE